MPLILRFLIALFLIGSAHAAAQGTQTLYKTVGPDGKVDYSDKPPADGRFEKTMQFENLPSSNVPDLSHTYVEQLKRMKASQAASAAPATRGVVLYAASWCGYCRSARTYLGKKGIAYQEIDIDTERGKESFAKASGGQGGVPLLLSANQRVQGYSVGAYDAFFAAMKPPAKPASR
ncbi:MAG: glutaredoxin domain-containing protein [Pseudomonadota bacterium]